MPESSPEHALSTDESGFFAQLRSFLGSFSGYLGARLELAGLESKHALVHYLKIIASLLVACLCLLFTYLFLVAGLVMIIAHYSGWALRWVFLGAAGVHLLLVLAALVFAKVLFAVPQLEATLAEFRKDQAWLKKNR